MYYFLNYFRCKIETDRAIEEFAENFRLKHKLENTAMDLWVNKIKEKVKKQDKALEKVKTNIKNSPVLQDEEIKRYL